MSNNCFFFIHLEIAYFFLVIPVVKIIEKTIYHLKGLSLHIILQFKAFVTI